MRFLSFSFLFLLFVLGPAGLRAADLSATFTKLYNPDFTLSREDQALLKDFDFYLVPGILSEVFLRGDKRSLLEFTILTSDYFSVQLDVLKLKYKFTAQRLSSSSHSVAEIRGNIRKALESTRRAKRKGIFITHSLGGVALLEELVRDESSQEHVAGILFLQSPFKGSPVADLYFENPYYLSSLLKPLLPFFNATEETIDYLRTTTRVRFMTGQKDKIAQLISKVPILTVGGVVNNHASLFKPIVDILDSGCIKIGSTQCISGIFFRGPYESSDGMVPLASSKLEMADFITLDQVDHGEMVLGIPFENYSRDVTLLVLLKMLLPKIKY